MIRRLGALIFAVCWAAACSAEGGGGETHFRREPATEQELGDMCDETAAWHQRCASGDEPNPTGRDWYAECKASPLWQSMWSEAIEAFEDCFKRLDCAGSDDRCLGAVVTQLKIDYQGDELFNECKQRGPECHVSQDECEPVLFFHDDARAAVKRCIGLSCSEFEACLADPREQR